MSNKSITTTLSQKRTRQKYFLAVHFGAGYHSTRKEEIYQKLSEDACSKGSKILKCGGSADDAVIAAVGVLENSKLVNAGRGCHLTLNETVECDAGFMSGSGRFGGIGAAPGIVYPSMAAKKLSDLKLHPTPLMPPNLLVGVQAKSWASGAGIKTCEDSLLICKRARRQYKKYFDSQSNGSNELMESDTVGAIALDKHGNVAAAASTGGGLYKIPGRVGPAAQYGCCVYASNGDEDSQLATAIAGTGTGEFLTEIRFASTCDSLIRQYESPIEGIKATMEKRVLRCKSSNFSPIAGMIGLSWDGRHGDYIVAHNATNIVHASIDSKSGSKVSMRFCNVSDGKEYSLQAFSFS